MTPAPPHPTPPPAADTATGADVALDAAEAERDRLALEVAALRGALPDDGLLSRASAEVAAIAALHMLPVNHPLCTLADSLADAAARIRAALASAAVAGDGAGEALSAFERGGGERVR